MKNIVKICLCFSIIIISGAFMLYRAYLYDANSTYTNTALFVVGLVLFFASALFSSSITGRIGKFMCQNCGHSFKPGFLSYCFGVHTLNTRRLKCPYCDAVTWCRWRLK